MPLYGDQLYPKYDKEMNGYKAKQIYLLHRFAHFFGLDRAHAQNATD